MKRLSLPHVLEQGFVRRLALVALGIWLGLSIWPVVSNAQAQGGISLFIPALSKNMAFGGIHGQLVLNGTPAAGETVVLGRPENAPRYFAVLATTTVADGTYSFPTAPVLSSGNTYNVIYVAPNPGGGTRIDYVQSYAIPYPTQSDTPVPTIELAPIVLVDPAANATVPYTYTYRWTMPAALSAVQPGSTFRVFSRNVFGMISDPMAGGPVSSGGEITMTLNSGSCQFCFLSGATYVWHIEVNGPNGQYRETLDRPIRFAAP